MIENTIVFISVLMFDLVLIFMIRRNIKMKVIYKLLLYQIQIPHI